MRTWARQLHHTFIPHPENYDRPYILRAPSLTFWGGLLLTLKIWLLVVFALYPLEASLSTITASRMVQLTNESRIANNLPALSTNSLLEKAAEAKARDILQKDYFAHISPDGKEPWDFILDAGYDYLYAGENLAIGFTTAEGAHEALIASPSHRENILNENFREIGIAVMTGDYKGMEVAVCVEMFGSTTKSLTKILKNQISGEQSAPSPAPTPKKEIPLSPAAPLITSPRNGDFVSFTRQTISGTASPESVVVLYADDKKIGQVEVDRKGNFSTSLFALSQNLDEGTHLIKAQAVDKKGNKSSWSKGVTIQLDFSAPQIDLQNSYILPLLSPFSDKFYLSLKVGANPNIVIAYFGDRIQNLKDPSQQEKEIYESVFTFPPKEITEGSKIRTKAIDLAGNQQEEVFALSPPNFILPTTEENHSYLAALSLKNKFTRFAITVFIIFSTLLILNILIRIKYQHFPTILRVILLLAFIGVLLLI